MSNIRGREVLDDGGRAYSLQFGASISIDVEGYGEAP